jgi:hypothetical protein
VNVMPSRAVLANCTMCTPPRTAAPAATNGAVCARHPSTNPARSIVSLLYTRTHSMPRHRRRGTAYLAHGGGAEDEVVGGARAGHRMPTPRQSARVASTNACRCVYVCVRVVGTA